MSEPSIATNELAVRIRGVLAAAHDPGTVQALPGSYRGTTLMLIHWLAVATESLEIREEVAIEMLAAAGTEYGRQRRELGNVLLYPHANGSVEARWMLSFSRTAYAPSLLEILT